MTLKKNSTIAPQDGTHDLRSLTFNRVCGQTAVPFCRRAVFQQLSKQRCNACAPARKRQCVRPRTQTAMRAPDTKKSGHGPIRLNPAKIVLCECIPEAPGRHLPALTRSIQALLERLLICDSNIQARDRAETKRAVHDENKNRPANHTSFLLSRASLPSSTFALSS